MSSITTTLPVELGTSGIFDSGTVAYGEAVGTTRANWVEYANLDEFFVENSANSLSSRYYYDDGNDTAGSSNYVYSSTGSDPYYGVLKDILDDNVNDSRIVEGLSGTKLASLAMRVTDKDYASHHDRIDFMDLDGDDTTIMADNTAADDGRTVDRTELASHRYMEPGRTFIFSFNLDVDMDIAVAPNDLGTHKTQAKWTNLFQIKQAENTGDQVPVRLAMYPPDGLKNSEASIRINGDALSGTYFQPTFYDFVTVNFLIRQGETNADDSYFQIRVNDDTDNLVIKRAYTGTDFGQYVSDDAVDTYLRLGVYRAGFTGDDPIPGTSDNVDQRVTATYSNFKAWAEADSATVFRSLSGSAGADTDLGRDGDFREDDSISGLGGNDDIFGGFGNDTLSGGTGSDTIDGYYGDDNLTGDDGADQLDGGFGNDTVIGGNGDDTLDGGYGNDSLEGGNDADSLQGWFGNDTLKGGGTGDTLKGYSGEDHLYGNSGSDKLYGGQDDDKLYGGTFNDTLWGDEGNDSLYGETGTDALYGGDGNDWMLGGDDNDALNGDAGADDIWGDGGVDTIYGGSGDDKLRGGIGGDAMYGDADNDTMWGEGGNDWLYGGTGNDKLFGGDGNDKIWGQDGTDSIYGDGGDDSLTGDDANDSLFGGSGDDTLRGFSGNDTLTGDAGNDSLLGGDGNDTFVFKIGFGDDTISGFALTDDVLDFSDFGLTWNDLDAIASQSGSSTVIDFGEAYTDVLTINSLTESTITQTHWEAWN